MDPAKAQALADCDGVAKTVALRILRPTYPGARILDEDRFGPDLFIADDLYGEVERRLCWHGERFPWETITIPLRKLNIIDHYGSHFLYFAFNHELSTYVLIRGEDIALGAQIKKSTSNQGMEPFFEIPTAQCAVLRVPEASRRNLGI